MATFRITAEIDNKWMMILEQITKHQEGFIWESIERLKEETNG